MTDTTQPVRPYPPGWSMDYGVVGAESDGTARVPFNVNQDYVAAEARAAEDAVGVPMEVCEVNGQWCYRPALPADTPDPRIVHLTTGSQTLCGVTSRDVSTAVTLLPEQMTCPDCQTRWDRIHSLPAPAAPATQPDPEVVAWMRERRAKSPDVTDGELLLDAALVGGFGHVDIAVRGASLIAARAPLTVADIPAGQGRASLHVGPDPQTGDLAVLFKEVDGTLAFIDNYPSEALTQVSAGARAWCDLLAATLPHVTTEES